MAFPIVGTMVTVPDVYEAVVLKHNNADATIKWANTYTFQESTPGRIPLPGDQIFVDIQAFERGFLYKDATVDKIDVRPKVYGHAPGSAAPPLFTIVIGLIGTNDAPPIGAGAPNPVGGEVVVRIAKTHLDGSRRRYNFYRNATDKNSVVALGGGRWTLTAFGIPTPAGTATLLGNTIGKDIVGGAPTTALLVKVSAFVTHPPLGGLPIWTVKGVTDVTGLFHAGVSTNKLSRKNRR